MQDLHASVQAKLEQIRAAGQAVDKLASRLREPATLAAFNKWSHDSWCISVAGDALVRLRLIAEQNFLIIESMSLVTSARYIFELLIWLRLFAVDRRYGLIYYDQLLSTQLNFYKDTLGQLEREVSSLKSLHADEQAGHAEVAASITAAAGNLDPAFDNAAALAAVSDRIDAEAARRFSLFGEAAKVNGYGFQAYLIETKQIPAVRQAVADIVSEQSAFEAAVPSDVKALRPSRWQWRSMAQKVGRVSEYDYVYSFASKLIHATPASITSDQKNLETSEALAFLRYIYVSFGDALELCRPYLPPSPPQPESIP